MNDKTMNWRSLPLGRLGASGLSADFYNLLLIIDGYMRIDISEHVLLISDPGLIFISARQNTNLVECSGSVCLLEFSTSYFEAFSRQNAYQASRGLFDPKNTNPVITLTVEELRPILQLKGQMEAELNTTGNKDLLLQQLVLLFQYADIAFWNQNVLLENSDELLMADFFSLLEQHFNRESKTAFYADQLGVTSRRLRQACKQITGKKIGAQIMGRRLRQGYYLVLETKLSMKEIAYESGFTSPAHFAVYFKRKYHLSPMLMRKSSASFSLLSLLLIFNAICGKTPLMGIWILAVENSLLFN